MKYISPFLSLFAALSLLLAVGCKPATDESPAADVTEREVSHTEAAVSDASHDWAAYTYQQKSQFIAKMEAELATLNRKIDELAVRVDQSSAEAKAAAAPRLDDLRKQALLLRTELDKVKDATASTWDKVKAGTSNTYDSLKDSFNDARQWMSDLLAP